MKDSHRYPWKWWLKDLKPPSEDAPTVFSTFACGGGSSMGYKRAGYRVVGNCEIDPKIAKVYEKNLHPEMSYVMDLREFNTLDGLPDCLYELDVLDGSPPCSTFSMAGSREKAWGVEKQFAEGQKRQRLDDLFFTYLDTVGKLMPKVFVAENVTGLIVGNANGYVNEIVKTARELGYAVQLFKLNAAFMGVPQRRERVFFIGNRMGYPKLDLSFSEEPVTFGEVRTAEGAEPASDKTVMLENYRKHGEVNQNQAAKRCPKDNAGATYNVPYFTTYVIEDDAVSPTITATCNMYRKHDMRRYSEGDARNASSFPQDYSFEGKDPYFITGMSVPPSMMANIAHEIRKQWLG